MRNPFRFYDFFKLLAASMCGAMIVFLFFSFYPGLQSAVKANSGSKSTLTSTPAGYSQSGTTTSTDPADNVPFGSETIADIVAKASPAVVKVQATVTTQVNNPFLNDPFFSQFFGNQFNSPQTEEEQMLGSGFIISPDGYILTNDHVVSGADSITVTLAQNDKTYTAQKIGEDSNLDLAVLKISAGSNLPVLTLGDSSQARVGDWVIAIGNPYGLDHTVTVGVLSAKGRPITAGDRTYSNLLQTDAAINPGNSGGPLLNLAGQVIGINTAVDSEAQGIGFAIPTSTVLSVLPHLINKTPTPFMGVSIDNVPSNIANSWNIPSGEGALVDAVQANSPADKAGIKQGDIIVKFNGQTVMGPDDLVARIQGSSVGAQVSVGVIRNGQPLTIQVTLGSD